MSSEQESTCSEDFLDNDAAEKLHLFHSGIRLSLIWVDKQLTANGTQDRETSCIIG